MSSDRGARSKASWAAMLQRYRDNSIIHTGGASGRYSHSTGTSLSSSTVPVLSTIVSRPPFLWIANLRWYFISAFTVTCRVCIISNPRLEFCLAALASFQLVLNHGTPPDVDQAVQLRAKLMDAAIVEYPLVHPTQDRIAQ